MNLTKNTILALGLFAAASVSIAQTTTTTEAAPVGTLGQSYTEASFGVSDIKHTSKNQYDLGIAANVPVSPYLDLGAGYDYAWMHKDGHANALTSDATLYTTINGVKPFVAAGLGYEWVSAPGFRDNEALWNVAAGVQIPVSIVTITPRISYTDDFRTPSRSSQQTAYGVEGNYWVTKQAAVFAGVDYVDVRNSSFDAWTYTVGARWKF